MDDTEQLHDRIRKSRISKGLSQAGLAAQTGVSQPTVANWESGSHTPRKNALNRIGRALDVEPVWLLSGDIRQAGDAALRYLENPIHHVPVYHWAPLDRARHDDNIAGYIPFPAAHNRHFALIEPDKDTEARHLQIIDPDINTLLPGGKCLCVERETGTLRACTALDDSVMLMGQIVAEIILYQGDLPK